MPRRRRVTSRDDAGSAVVDFVLVMTLLVPLVLGIVQVGLVLHVRNTVTAAASDGARAGAPLGSSSEDAVRRTRTLIQGALADHHADDVTTSIETIDGTPTRVVEVVTSVPPLGLFGPGITVRGRGHAVLELPP